MSVSTLGAIGGGPGVLETTQLTNLESVVTDQNANNTFLVAAITAAASGLLPGGASGLTAHSGGGQGSALALAAAINSVGTVAAIADSVKLPTSAAGALIGVINDAALSLQVFGASTDTIDDVTTTVGVPLAGKSSALYFCPVAGKWYQVKRDFLGLQTLSASGAVLPHVAATYVITKAGVAALTLAAPTTVVDDGRIIVITSGTANAHTLTATGLFNSGAAATDLATFAAFAGATITLMAYAAKWNVLSSNGIVLS